MIKKDYNKYTGFIDRFPFIIVVFIAVFAIVLIFQLKAKFPMPFFSVNTSSAQGIAYSTYPFLVATPSDEDVLILQVKICMSRLKLNPKQLKGLIIN